MRGRAFVLALVFCCTAFLASAQVQPVRPGQEASIRRAVFAGNSLWLLSDAGQLFTVANGGDSFAFVPSSQPILDLWRRDGEAVIISCSAADCGYWKIQHWDGGKFVSDASVPARGENLVAAGSQKEVSLLLTPSRIVELRDGRAAEQKLASPLNPAPVDAVLFSGRGVYLGFNAGEWGGGLKFIDRASGETRVIEKNTSRQLCGGPLNTACDPVTGLAVEPWKPDCIVAAIGLVHIGPHGRVVEVCGGDVSRIYFKPFGEQPPRDTLDNGEPFSTVAFFGLEAKGQSLWAVGIDGIYQIGRDGARSRPLPRFQQVGPFYVSFSDPDVVLVLTDINQRLSLSGSVPLLVPR